MGNILLIDIGSTFTKLHSIDTDTATLIASAQAPTTVSTDVKIGFNSAKEKLDNITGPIKYEKKLACSSAAGGLAVAVSGLVESLTLKAAKHAALGAGARIIKGFHHVLTKSDINYLENTQFDIFLLTGGTDGGNTETIIQNAKILAGMTKRFPIVVAGNRNAEDEVTEILKRAGRELYVCPNILPNLETMNIGPVNEVIRKIFIEKIVDAKGITAIDDITDNDLIPTPYAVLEAVVLMSKGFDESDGLGSITAIDIGGATTDVHSVCNGYSVRDDVYYEGLVEPEIMRTVEGDIGVRWNAKSICALINEDNNFSGYLEKIKSEPSVLFGDEAMDFETSIASKAIETAMTRHCGHIEQHYTPRGLRYIQKGKDFSKCRAIILTGGPAVNCKNKSDLYKAALFSESSPDSLKPVNPDIYIDEKYILASAGLLSSVDKKLAFIFMKKYLKKIKAGSIYD